MIGRLNHVAIAVPDLEAATRLYRDTLGAKVSRPVAMAEHGVTIVFVELPNTKIELLHPLGRGVADRQFPRAQSRRRHPSCLLRGRRHPGRPRPAQGRGRTYPRRRRAEDRRARQAGAVPASEGFLRHPDRAGTGVISHFLYSLFPLSLPSPRRGEGGEAPSGASRVRGNESCLMRFAAVPDGGGREG